MQRLGEIRMQTLNRIIFDPAVMGGKPCIRGIRVTVEINVGLMPSGLCRVRIKGRVNWLSFLCGKGSGLVKR